MASPAFTVPNRARRAMGAPIIIAPSDIQPRLERIELDRGSYNEA